MRRWHSSLLLILLLPLLQGCAGEGERGCREERVDSLQLCLERGWEALTDQQRSMLHLSEETIAAYRRDTEGGRLSLVVTREPLPRPLPQLQYGRENRAVVARLPHYQEISSREIDAGGSAALLVSYNASADARLPARRFIQLSLTVGSTGYTVTGSHPPSMAQEAPDALVTMIEGVEVVGEGTKEDKETKE